MGKNTQGLRTESEKDNVLLTEKHTDKYTDNLLREKKLKHPDCVLFIIYNYLQLT